MNQSVEPNGHERGRLAMLDYLKPALIVLLIGIGVLGLKAMNDNPAGESQKVKPGSDYYISVALVEVTETDEEGNPWDQYNGTGPDIRVEIFWKGNRIYKSNKKEDTFLAKWSNAEIDLRDLAITGKNASMDDVINAARVNVREEDTLEIRVQDEDLLTADAVGTVEIKLRDLNLGDNVFAFDKPGVKRIVVRANDMTAPVDVLK